MSSSQPSPAFLEMDVKPTPPELARYHVLSAPFEHTVSYGGGTAKGPQAILEASQQLETFDGVDVPADAGIYTAPALACSGSPADVLDRIADAVYASAAAGAIPILLGGEHTVTAGAVQGCRRLGEHFGVVQFDAHADLRDTYEGSRYSHACVMRRLHELGCPLFQIGVRSLTREEHEFRRRERIGHLDAAVIARSDWPSPLIPREFPDVIYITFDIDALDPSIMPATGTPEPGGLDWYPALELLRQVVEGRSVIGADLVELAPVEGLHAPDYAAARLVYNLMGLINRHAVL